MRYSQYNFTKYGWFYFVPIIHDPLRHVTVMRWTKWWWPVHLCIKIHQTLNFISGTSLPFPLRLYEDCND